MSARDPAMRRINFLRACRVLIALCLAVNLFFGVVDTIGGLAVAFASFGAALFVAAIIGFQTYAIRRLEKHEGTRGSLPVALLRKIARRPRMAPEDYRHLREMEIELGFEPSEPNADVKAPPPAVRPGFDPFAAAKELAVALDNSRERIAKEKRAIEAEAKAADQFRKALREQESRMRAIIRASKPDLGNPSGDLARDMRDLQELDRISLVRSVPWCQEHMCPVDDPACSCPTGGQL